MPQEPCSEDPEPEVPRRAGRFPVFLLSYLLVFATALTVVLWPSPARPRFGDAVLDGTGSAGPTHWSAGSEAGAMSLRQTRFEGADAPPGAQTAIELQRDAGTGQWAYALADLRSPERFFQTGQAYRMEVYVRDLDASRQPIGLTLANQAFSHRPTQARVYAAYSDSSWHLLTTTFVATAAASSDTALYLALPPTGAMHWQLTRASVRAVDAAAPATVSGRASTIVSFAGSAGAAPDPRQWSYETTGQASTDLQTNTDQPTNASLDGAGRLVLTARRESVVGADPVRRAYTSARVTTVNKVTVPAGSYLEVTIQQPASVGVRPVFALIGADISRVRWPAAGELDVLRPAAAGAAVAHLAAKDNPRTDLPYTWAEVGDATPLAADGRAHRYGVYFDRRTVRYYVDRRLRMAIWASDAEASGRSWPFGSAQYLMLTIAVASPAHTVFPQRMTVGPVSIWAGGIPF